MGLVGEFFYINMEPSAVLDLRGTFLEVDPAWIDVVGFGPDDLVGQSMLDFAFPDDVDGVRKVFDGLAAGEPVEGLRIRFRASDESFRWLEWVGRPIVEDGSVVSVFRDVTSVRNTEQYLRVARDEAERASRYKSEFLSRMSHELRTPLNSIIGFGQLLAMDDLQPEQAEHVSFILKSSRHLLALINEVLDIARIETGNMRISVERVAVSDKVRLAADLTRPLAAERGINLICDCPPDDLFVLADNQRLVQVLLNLLSNAVKYSDAGDTVTVSTEVSGGTVMIAVSDTGPGIADEDQAKLFIPFERLGAENTEIEGTGVGLPLSRALSQEMGGALTVTSELGVGSTFLLELRQAFDPEFEGGGIGKHGRNDNDSSASAVDGAIEDVTVLCIEDNLTNIELIEAAMSKLGGVRLLTATQGRLGLDIAASARPNLILVDLHLPDMGGEEVLKRIRQDPSNDDCQVVVCTADTSSGLAEQMRLLGASYHLTKPLDIDRLFQIVEGARPSR